MEGREVGRRERGRERKRKRRGIERGRGGKGRGEAISRVAVCVIVQRYMYSPV